MYALEADKITENELQRFLRGPIVIVVDDGPATGSTMIAALHALRAKSAKKLVCAVPWLRRTLWKRSDRTLMKWCA